MVLRLYPTYQLILSSSLATAGSLRRKPCAIPLCHSWGQGWARSHTMQTPPTPIFIPHPCWRCSCAVLALWPLGPHRMGRTQCAKSLAHLPTMMSCCCHSATSLCCPLRVGGLSPGQPTPSFLGKLVVFLVVAVAHHSRQVGGMATQCTASRPVPGGPGCWQPLCQGEMDAGGQRSLHGVQVSLAVAERSSMGHSPPSLRFLAVASGQIGPNGISPPRPCSTAPLSLNTSSKLMK